ncbi:unnamed protein product [Euphydryas editha]|uniref:Growth arrest-specific protein 8 n=1 Tax=Euphydryas editha TaxID=104508 RepID=A0AAU9TTV9_EUPED|nr:unnamed protein product [Euphydryas editha]
MLIKNEFLKLQKDVDERKKFVHNIYETITQAWERNQQKTEIIFREHTQRLTADQDLELSDMKAALNDKHNIVSNIKKAVEDLKLTDPETNDYDPMLKTQFATLENEKASKKRLDSID